jgi:hypothetical protein
MEIVSADQFVDGLIAALVTLGKKRIDLDDPDVDQKFSEAYGELLGQAEALQIAPDFIIVADPFYGDSTCLRNALLNARDLKSVELSNPRFLKLGIRMKNKSAEQVLSESKVPKDVLLHLAKRHLTQIAS